MGNNHESFLKMIGYEDESYPERSATHELVAEGSLTQENSDWSQTEPAESAEEVVNDYHQEIEQESQEAIEASIENSNTEEDWSQQPVEPEPSFQAKTNIDSDSTSFYTNEELQEILPSNDGGTWASPSPQEEPVANGTINGTLNMTRHTMAYEEAGVDVENGTAHFDYDSDEEKENGYPRIIVHEGNTNSKSIYLSQFPLTIGRDPTNHLVIDDTNASRFHAEIRKDDRGLILYDLGSTNGLKVNGLIESESILRPNDILQIGGALIEFLPPGQLSKGVMAQAAVAESNSPKLQHKIGHRRKRIRLPMTAAVSLALVAGGLFLFNPIKNFLERNSKVVIGNTVHNEVTDLKASIERQYQKPLNEIPDDQVKKIILGRIEESTIGKMIPAEVKAQVQNIPAEAMKIFLDEPDALAAIARGEASTEILVKPLEKKLSQLVQDKKFDEALVVLDLVKQYRPDDSRVTQIAERIKQIQENSNPANKHRELNEIERKEFNQYMSSFNEHIDKLVKAEQFEEAAKFSGLVAEKLMEQIESDATLEDFLTMEAKKWADQAAQFSEKENEFASKINATESMEASGMALVAEIKAALDVADTEKARSLIEQFLTSFPDHSLRSEVVLLRAELDKHIEAALSTTKSTIEKFLEAESFASAWAEYYRFVDTIPDQGKAVDIKELIEKSTKTKATQYYNQARVFEFEADDLVAAEQYYKRALDTADPRSELSQKATRRYSEVRRKSIQ